MKEVNKKNSVSTTKNVEKNVKNESVKPLTMVSEIKDIKENFGKYAIIIKGNLIYRCSTQTLEKGPKSLLDYYLPNYGKMRKFVVLEDGVYELHTDAEQKNTEFAQYEVSDKVNIDPKKIDFNLENAWNAKKTAA